MYIEREIKKKEHKGGVKGADDQLPLAIGKGKQKGRLAAKLAGWRIDIKGDGAMAQTDATPESEKETKEKIV